MGREPIESYITANGQIRRPTSEWEKEEILKSDLTSKVLVDDHFKYGDEKRSIRSTIVAYRSDEQKKFVEESEEWKTCSEDEKEGKNCLHLAELLEIWHLPLIRYML